VSNSVLKALTATAVVVAVSSFAFGVSAQDKKAKAAPKPPACKTMKDEAACTARDDCAWKAAAKKGAKGSCGVKPAPKKEAPKKDDKKK
jgi:hypothetical protein